jgi:DNA-binding transcriptional LysR family regulator
MLKRHPHVQLELEEELPSVALRAVKSGTLDAAFIGVPEEKFMRGLERRVIWVSTQEILLPANHRLAKRRSVRLVELRDEFWCIWDEKHFPGFGRHVLKHCRRAGYRTKVVAVADSLASLLIRVASGAFITYVPPIARELPHPGVVFVPTDPLHALDIPVQLVWRPDSPHHEALAWLADTMAATVPPQAQAFD